MKMVSIEFYVSVDEILVFTERIIESELINQIIGITEDNELIIYVEYYPEDNDFIESLKKDYDNFVHDEENTLDDFLSDPTLMN